MITQVLGFNNENGKWKIEINDEDNEFMEQNRKNEADVKVKSLQFEEMEQIAQKPNTRAARVESKGNLAHRKHFGQGRKGENLIFVEYTKIKIQLIKYNDMKVFLEPWSFEAIQE